MVKQIIEMLEDASRDIGSVMAFITSDEKAELIRLGYTVIDVEQSEGETTHCQISKG